MKDDASSANGAKFEIGSVTKLQNDVENKEGNADDHGIVGGGSNIGRSVVSQSTNMDECEDCRPKILLMGLPKSGKSSIQKVVSTKCLQMKHCSSRAQTKLLKKIFQFRHL